MDQSRINAVLAASEPDRVVAPRSESDGDSGAVLAGKIARQLIAIRSLAEGEEVVLSAMRAASGLDWAALYRPTKAGYQLTRTWRDEELNVPKGLDYERVNLLLDGVRRVGGCSSDLNLGPKLKKAGMVVRLESEFDEGPALMLLGFADAGSRRPVNLRTSETVADVCSAGLTKLELLDRLRSEVFVDFLTNCYNRRGLEEHLGLELVRARRYERPLCLLLLDLDQFKEINDVLGHQAGDYVLRKVGEVLRSAFRTTDRVCRYGGDEFAVIFPETPKDEVVRLAERLRKKIAKLFPDVTIPGVLTPSIGVASYPADASEPEDLIKTADQAMYRAKEAGRNQVVAA